MFFCQSQQGWLLKPGLRYASSPTVGQSLSAIMVFDSFTPVKFEWKFRYAIVESILVIDGWGISCEIAQIWMSVDFTNDQSTLVQIMAWCRQATSHYLGQCWPRSLSPCGVTRPQWVNKEMFALRLDRGQMNWQCNLRSLRILAFVALTRKPLVVWYLKADFTEENK